MTLDPLLPPPPTVTKKSEPSRHPRRPSPAAAARILATGLATTAMLGLTAGYALAKKAQQPENSPASATTDGDTVLAPGTPANTSQNQTPSVSTPESSNNSTSNSSTVTTPPVVMIPVPEIAPAQPGNNWNGGNNQPSNGSN